MNSLLTLSDQDDPAAAAVIGGGLNRFNAEMAGGWDRRALNVLLTDPASGEVVGGLVGRTSLGVLLVDLVFLPASARGQGLGTAMLRQAEEEARRRGCAHAMLYTITFQAPAFYEKLGYVEFGRVPCAAPGQARVFMSKVL